jgi:hypothetical protein
LSTDSVVTSKKEGPVGWNPTEPDVPFLCGRNK